MKRLIELFTQHPHEINETYVQHLKFTLIYGAKLIGCGLILFIHGLFPFLFKSTARDKLLIISKIILKRNPLA